MTIAPDDYHAISPKDLPYLNLKALEGRPIPVHSFHDGNRWHEWIPLGNGLLQPLQIHDAIEVVYLAEKPVCASDAYLSFVDFIYKYVQNKDTHSFIHAITSDIFNLSASLKKIDLLGISEDLGGSKRLVTTELEYLFLLCRSMFDLLQEIILRIWDTVHLIDTSIKKKQLPSSFRKVVLKDNIIRTSQEIQERFGLSPAIAKWYSDCAPFFCKLKDARDAIVHQPIGEPLIFVDGKGISIGVDSSPLPFRRMMEWPESILENAHTGPLNFFVAHFIHETLAACEKFVPAITQEIQFAPDFAPNHRFFMRSPSLGSLMGIRRVLDIDPWASFTLHVNFSSE